MKFNENYGYETQLEKEKSVLHCVFVSSSKVNKENDTQTCEKTLIRFIL